MTPKNLTSMLPNEKLVVQFSDVESTARLSATPSAYYIETSGGAPARMTEDDLLLFIQGALNHLRLRRLVRVLLADEQMGT